MSAKLPIIMSGLVTLGVLSTATFAEPKVPTSRPASRPIAPPAALGSRDSIEVKSNAHKLSFRVPKAWEKMQISISAGEAYGYRLPAPANRNASLPPPDRSFQLYIMSPCQTGETLEQYVESLRVAYAKDAGKPIEFTRDAATTIVGTPAWQLDFPSERKINVTTSAHGKTESKVVRLPCMKRMVIWSRDGSYCQAITDYDAAGAPAMERVSDQILASFAETD